MDPITLAGLEPATLVFVLLIAAVSTLGGVVVFLYKNRQKDQEVFIEHLRNESAQLAAMEAVVDSKMGEHVAVLRRQLKQIAEKLGVTFIDP